MADITPEITKEDVHGGTRVQYGTFSGAAVGSNTIKTDMAKLNHVSIQQISPTATTDTVYLSDTYPVEGGDFDIEVAGNTAEVIYKAEGE